MSDRFIIEKQISSRNSADAFLAVDTTTELKVRLRRIHSNMAPDKLKSVKDAFRVTQRQLALVKSDLVLQITDSGIDDEGAWLALPYYESQQLLSVHTLPILLPDFHNLATQLFTALVAIHQENLVHGALTANSIDVVPPTTPGGQAGYRVRDLGMRRLLLLVQNPSAISQLPSDNAMLAPELFDGQDASPVTDIYMAGQLLYYLVAGGHPWVGLNEEEALAKHLAHDIPLAHTVNPDIPEEISLWLDSLIQPDQKLRIQSAEEALQALPFVPADIKKQPTKLVYHKGKLTSAHTVRAEKELESAGRKKFPPYLYVLGGLAIAAGVSLFFIFSGGDDQPASTQSSEAVKEPVVATIKAMNSGSITGSTLRNNKSIFQAGSNATSSAAWGTKKSKNAYGPDIGATYRAYVTFRIADIINASNDDDFVNAASLTNLKLELMIPAKASDGILPMIYPAEIVKNTGATQINKVSQDLENGVLGIAQKGSVKTEFLFTLTNVDLSDAQYNEYIVLMITTNKRPANNQIIMFERNAATLKITK